MSFVAPPTRSQQAEDSIRRLMAQGTPGDRLPGEAELAKLLSTSRVTIREALTRLWHAGLVVRRWGAGTFIADPAEHRQPGSIYLGLDHVGSLPRRLTAAGHTVALSHFAVGSATWPDWLKEPTGRAQKVERCMTIDGVPAILLHDYLPLTIHGRPAPDPRVLSDIDHDLPGLFRDIGTRIVKDEARLSGIALDSPAAEQLGLQPGAIVLHARQRSLSETGDVITSTEAYYRDDVFTTMLVRVVSE